MRALRRQAQQHAALAELEARAHLALAERRSRDGRAPSPSGTTSMRSRLHAEQLDEVVARALRVGDHASERRAAGGTSTRMPWSRMPACASGKRA